jgi:CubicO group peptidase (beta-lactamase class C family)
MDQTRAKMGLRRTVLRYSVSGLFVLTLNVLILARASNANSANDDLTARVDAVFAACDKPDSPGCAVAVIQDSRIVYEHGYGLANLEHNIPISPSTVFYIASTSKQFTAASIALLAQSGKLSVDDPVRKYVPELSAVYDGITIRHLVYHTSGIRDFQTLLDVQGRTDDVNSERDIIDLLARQKALSFKPGEQFEYCNSGYFLLGVIVKRVSGKSLQEFAADNIFKPLGMKNTHFHDDRTMIVKNRATGYVPRRGGGYAVHVTNYEVVGNAGVMTTVEDLFHWDQNFYDNKLGGNGNLLAQLLTPGTLNNGEKVNYAYGLQLGEYKGLRTVKHDGGFAGFVTEMLRFPDQRFTVICLANVRGTIDSTALAYQVADIYLANELKSETSKAAATPPNRTPASVAPPISLTPTQLAAYVGDYYSDELQVTYRVVLENGRLFMKYRQVINGELTPAAPDVFKLFGVVSVQFIRDNRNQISGFVPQNGGARNIRFLKI